jgi:transposase InsO family protein
MVVPLHHEKFWSTDDTVYVVTDTKEDVGSHANVKRVHKVCNHKSENNLLHAYRNAGVLDDKVRQNIGNVTKKCAVCQKFKKSKKRPKIHISKVTDFNQTIALDLKHFVKGEVLWMVDCFTQFIQGIVIKDKSAETIVDSIMSAWSWRFGIPQDGFFSDNGSEFQNSEVQELAAKVGLKINFGPLYSPWTHGLNERNHYSADTTVKKILEMDKKMPLQQAVNMACWTHNTNVNILGYAPMTLVTGKNVVIPGISTGSVATEAQFKSEHL